MKVTFAVVGLVLVSCCSSEPKRNIDLNINVNFIKGKPNDSEKPLHRGERAWNIPGVMGRFYILFPVNNDEKTI